MSVRVEYDQVGSTQVEAVRLARHGTPPGTVVVARSQSGGLGRSGRSWSSPRGGLYVSVVVESPRESPGLLPLAVAVELRDTWARKWGAPVRIKWPNDLVVEEPSGPLRKLAGIIIDRIAPSRDRPLAVVGVGANVRRPASPLPPELIGRTAYLEEFATPPPGLSAVETSVTGSVSRAAHRLAQPGGGGSVVAECRRHLHGVGRTVLVDGVEAGVLRSLADDGGIRVERDGELAIVYSGDLAVRADA